jgi:hypothetical protein
VNDCKKPFDRTSWHDLRNKDGDEQEADDRCRNRSHLGNDFASHAPLLLRRDQSKSSTVTILPTFQQL